MTVLTCILGDTVMASSARIFFAGVGTTFLILGVGFGGGLLMANSALKDSSGYQARATGELPSPVRVILPTTAEAAQPPQPPTQTSQQAAVVDSSASEPVQAAQPEKRTEKPDAKKAEAEARERRKRHAERKSRREAARAKQRMERQHEEAPVMAFGGDDTSRLGLFGN